MCALRITFSEFPLSPLQIFTIEARMTTNLRLSGRYAREVPPENTELTEIADNDSDDDRDPNVRQSNTPSLYNEPVSVNTAVLKSRALHIRDILSTFSRHNFPSEHIDLNIFNRIALLEGPKAIEDCIEQEDLVSTIFLLAVNNWAQYRILRRVLPEDLCAQHFQQKLQRRINAQIQNFDSLDVAARSDDPPGRDQIYSQVCIIAAELNHITMIIGEDRAYRRQVEVETAAHLVHMMQAVCRRNYRPGNRSASRQSPNGHHNSNLFQILFDNTSSRGARFGLDALKAFSTDAIMEQHEELKIVRNLLVRNNTWQDYVMEFDGIAGMSSP
jgi:hypothetical protein